MDTFTVGEDTYSVRRMDPRVQFFVLKRIMRFFPAVTGLGKIMAALMAGESPKIGDAMELIVVLSPLVAETPDADLDFVSDACFDVVRQQGRDGDQTWYAVRDPKSGVVSNQNNLAVLRKISIIYNVLLVTFAPAFNEIAPNMAGMFGPGEERSTASL